MLVTIIKNHQGFILFLFALLLFRGMVADWHPVPSGSMKPNILEGDLILVNKLAYDVRVPFTGISLAKTGQPKRGDIIVFSSEATEKRMIKRVVALPGDTVMLRDNRLIINHQVADYMQEQAFMQKQGRAMKPLRIEDQDRMTYLFEEFQDHLQHIVQINTAVGTSLQNFGPVLVTENQYFVLGDNRDNSADSRVFGTVPGHEIRGKAIRVLGSVDLRTGFEPRYERFLYNFYPPLAE